jgi:hypothetical protein
VTALAVLLALSGRTLSSPFAAVTVAVDVTEVEPTFGATVTTQDCAAPDAKLAAVQTALPAVSVQPAGTAVTEPPVSLIVSVELPFCPDDPELVIVPVTGNVAPPDDGAEIPALTSESEMIAARAGTPTIDNEPATSAASANRLEKRTPRLFTSKPPFGLRHRVADSSGVNNA